MKNQNIRKFLSHTPTFDETVYIDTAATVIGQVSMGSDVSIWPMSVIRGDVNHITIGANSNIQDGSVLHVTHVGPYDSEGGPLTIGSGVTVGHGAILHACDIGDYCLVGMGSTVLDKAHMEHHSMLGAGSVLTPGKIIKTGELWVGSPAKKVKDLTAKQIEWLEYSAHHYVKLKNQYMIENT